MGFWKSMFGGGGSDLARVEEKTRDLEKISALGPFTVDTDYTDRIRLAVSDLRSNLRKNGNLVPSDLYSRMSGILDLIARFVVEQVAEKGLSGDQRALLRLTVESKLPELLSGYLELSDADRADDDTLNALSVALIAIQRSMEDLRELALAGSIHESKRFQGYAQQLTASLDRDSQVENLDELLKN